MERRKKVFNQLVSGLKGIILLVRASLFFRQHSRGLYPYFMIFPPFLLSINFSFLIYELVISMRTGNTGE
jgi:hypothetical protein